MLLTRQEMAIIGHDVPSGPYGKQCHVPFRALGAGHPILCPEWYDRWSCGELMLDRVKARVARGIAMMVAVGVDHHRHEIGLVERQGRVIKGGLVEAPAR
jgi:hypothetical protein